MIIVVDSTAVALLVNPAANPPDDPNTNEPVARVPDRIAHFIAGLDARTDTLVIPTPVMAEVLVKAEDGAPGVMEQLAGMARIRIRAFDERAAIEVAMMTREALQAGDKKSGSDQPWQKVKFDRQIIAVARVQGAARLYADDRKLVAFAKALGMDVVSTWDLPLPPPKTPDLFDDMGEAPREHEAREGETKA